MMATAPVPWTLSLGAPRAGLPRRLLTVSVWVLATALWWGLAPLTVTAAALHDATVGRRLGALRTVALVGLALHADVAGVLAAGALWVAQVLRPAPARAYVARHRALKRTWARVLAQGGFGLFGVRVVQAGAEALHGTPCVVCLRHASLADVLLGPWLVEIPGHADLRYVLKRELRWQPALDIVGHRVGAVFVDRHGVDPEGDRDRVASLGRALGPDEGVLIYPEGTRFSAAKRARILDRLRDAGDAGALAYAEGLTHVLPPHEVGVLALLREADGADVVFGAHVGLEAVATAGAFFRGDAVGTVVRVRWWRVPADRIPAGDAERAVWLRAQWARMDAEVAALADGSAVVGPV